MSATIWIIFERKKNKTSNILNDKLSSVIVTPVRKNDSAEID